MRVGWDADDEKEWRQAEESSKRQESPAEETDAAARQREMREVLSQCERFLNGHGWVRPQAMLERLAREAGADELSDIYGRGDLIESFEQEVAGLLGKEAAVFMPSGTMAQQIALRIWADRKGNRRVGLHATSHPELHELKGYEELHGLHGVLIGERNSVVRLSDLEALSELVAAVLLELPMREIGGQLPEWDDLVAQADWAHARGVALHMDGARLWEAAPYYDRGYAEVAALFDSVYVSCYKGLGAIAGAVLCGPADVIAEARVWQRRHGGNLVQQYPFVLSARLGLRERLAHFPSYHERALAVARVLREIAGISVKPDPPQTHMMHVYLRGDRERMQAEALAIARDERVALFGGLRATDVPGVWFFELALGDGARAIGDDEVRTFFQRVIAAGG